MLEAQAPYFRQRVETHGTVTSVISFALPAGRDWLIEVRERGNDALVEVAGPSEHFPAQADHPERRSGTRRLIVSTVHAAVSDQRFSLEITGKEHEAVNGSAEVGVLDLAGVAQESRCMRALHALAAADADYAVGQQISRGRLTATMTAHEAYARAAEEYLEAQMTLDGSADAWGLRGEAALALAAVDYYDLQDWRSSAEWAVKASGLFGVHDVYRRARARALAAAAWIEIANGDATRKDLFGKARRTLGDLYAFHAARQEFYDAALQVNNVGLADYYDGRFRQCIAAAGKASGLFAKLGETPRQGLAWQNRALCFWGLGDLPAALEAFNRALENLGPEPYPQLYMLTLNNTALMHFALGHFDDALRLLDRALTLAVHLQNRRAEALSLYGIGVTYYGLGDRLKAQEFLERTLAIRTAAFDGRGRQATLRSLATVYADLGQYTQAVAFDREALVLATTPMSRALGRIQLATHSAFNGDATLALEILDDLVLPGVVPDPLVRAQARLQRAVIERGREDYAAALRDLTLASAVFRRLGNVTDGFSADLERARNLERMGDTQGALASVEAALARSEAIRTQTANPEFRAQLQLPLRAAYDLKLDLLWQQFETASNAGKVEEATRIARAAFQSADSARARSFADIAAERYSAAVRNEVGADLTRRAMLHERLAGLRFALDSRVDGAGSADAGVQALYAESAATERELDTLNTRIATRAAAAGHATLSPGDTLVAVPQDTAIIAFWLGAHEAYGWTATIQGIHWARLVDPASIMAAAHDFHDALAHLSEPRERRWQAGRLLFSQIIRPLEPWIAAYKRWYVIPDAALQYVPMAALRRDSPNDAPYVAMTHDVAQAPAAWLLLAQRQARKSFADPRMLLVSDPVYERSDPRLAGLSGSSAPEGAQQVKARGAPADRSYRRLPGTAREAEAIRRELPGITVDALSGLDASRERVLTLDWSLYRFIHIASHGEVSAQTPALSALMLSTYDRKGERLDGALRSADLSAMTLNAEMAVFSGCDTALGKDVLNEGMVGISYTTLARGAGAVVSSLWQVPDEIGASFMTELYGHVLHDSMSPVTALGASMRSVLSRNPAADPALWAAFQMSVASL